MDYFRVDRTWYVQASDRWAALAACRDARQSQSMTVQRLDEDAAMRTGAEWRVARPGLLSRLFRR
jgi:hypothetical protein